MSTNEKKPQASRRLEYGQSYVPPQRYENLISPNSALRVGTIFRDLIRPYKEKE